MSFIKAWDVKANTGTMLGRAYKLNLPKENSPITVRYRVKPRNRAGLHWEIFFDDKQHTVVHTADVLCTIKNQAFVE